MFTTYPNYLSDCLSDLFIRILLTHVELLFLFFLLPCHFQAQGREAEVAVADEEQQNDGRLWLEAEGSFNRLEPRNAEGACRKLTYGDDRQRAAADIATKLVRANSAFVTVNRVVAYIGPPSGPEFDSVFSDLKTMGLQGDAEITFFPPGIRGVCEDESVTLIQSLTDQLLRGIKPTPYVGKIIQRVKKRRANGTAWTEHELLQDGGCWSTDNSDDDDIVEVKRPAKKQRSEK